MRDEEGDLSQLAEGNNADAGQASYDDNYSDVLMTGGNQTGSNVNRTAIIREFLLDVGLSESSFSGDLSEM